MMSASVDHLGPQTEEFRACYPKYPVPGKSQATAMLLKSLLWVRAFPATVRVGDGSCCKQTVSAFSVCIQSLGAHLERQRRREKALLTSAVELPIDWTDNPLGTAQCLQAALGRELTEKLLHCAKDISTWETLLQLPGKCTGRTFLAILFLWEFRIPQRDHNEM